MTSIHYINNFSQFGGDKETIAVAVVVAAAPVEVDPKVALLSLGGNNVQDLFNQEKLFKKTSPGPIKVVNSILFKQMCYQLLKELLGNNSDDLSTVLPSINTKAYKQAREAFKNSPAGIKKRVNKGLLVSISKETIVNFLKE